MWSTAGTYLSDILNADELKLRLIEACFGIQQTVADKATGQWRVCLNACVLLCKKRNKGKHDEQCCDDVLFHNVCYETYITVFCVSQLLTSHDF